jgi:hypothetical protein
MWAIAKLNKNSFQNFMEDVYKKTNKECKFYKPQLLLQKYKNGKIINQKIDLIGDYVFCYHENFKNNQIFTYLKYTRGLKYFLNNHQSSQKEIHNFINYCLSLENEEGLITRNFFKNYLDLNRKYKFITGPFLNKIFKVLSVQKNKMKILVGGLKTNIKIDKFLFNTI